MRQRVEACIEEAAKKDAWLAQQPPQVEYFGFQAEGSTVDRDSALLQTLSGAHRLVTGKEMEYFSSTGLTDMRYFNLYTDIPATWYGPRGGNIHNANEYVELDSIIAGAKTLALFILEWCGCAEGR